MGNFALNVESWRTKSWDSQHQHIVAASGVAWFIFGCERRLMLPLFPGKPLTNHEFTVVQIVKQPDREIGLEDARKLEPQAQVGSKAKLAIPASAVNAAEISEAVRIILKQPVLPPGSVEVQFTNLTIAPTANAEVGMVLAGNAVYPLTAANNSPAAVPEDNFTLYLNSLTLTTQGASANGFLQMPPSIIDPGTGHPGQIALGNFQISSQCAFHLELPNLAYGPWAIGNTEVQVQGTGVTADFDTTWAAPSAPAGSSESKPSWEGVLLGAGNTVTPTDTSTGPIISNSGYVRGKYSYPRAEVSPGGFHAELLLSAPFAFATLEPFGYFVQLGKGSIELTNSTVSGGQFGSVKVTAPPSSVVYDSGRTRLIVDLPLLTLASNLDLYGRVQIQSNPQEVFWGDSTQTPLAATRTWYYAGGFGQGYFGVSGTNYSNYFPLNAQDQFTPPGTFSLNPLVVGLQGLTLINPNHLDVLTSDTPNAAILQFIPRSDAQHTWLNIVYDGVHASFPNYVSRPQTSLDLGPVNKPFYMGVTPFKASSGSVTNPPSYSLSISFVASAVWNAGMSGTVALPEPVKANLDFSQMAFTSTGEITAGQVPLNKPLKLDYWGVEVTKKNGAKAGAVMDVHSGQVFFTAAGIGEPHHFAEPFYLIWGKMLANGMLGDLEFDHNSAGQKFDGFCYVPAYEALSDYVTTIPGWLKTAGCVSFDFFGAKYVNINDTNTPSLQNPPYNGRDVGLVDDSDPNGAYQATDHTLIGDWSQGFGDFNFTYNYDSAVQDGFTGTGTAHFLWIKSPLASTIVMKADPEFCICINDPNSFRMQLGPLADFATIGKIAGCGCIKNGQLEQIMLSAELELDSVVLSSACCASMQFMMTPTVSQVQFQGDMLLTVDDGSGSRLEVVGSATFTVNREQDYVEGNVGGHIDASPMHVSLIADGQLDWHISAPVSAQSYQEIQGRLSVTVVYPLGGVSVEGGFYLGINAPKGDAWVLNTGMDSHFGLNTNALPDTLTGVYGYVKGSASVNLFVVSGGYTVYAGPGGFWLPAFSVGPLNAVAPGAGLGVPYVIANVGIDVWGEILGGLVSAEGWTDMQVILPYPFSFQGTVGLKACVAWVACGSVDISVGLNSSRGFYLN